jgi:hypothetical protein
VLIIFALFSMVLVGALAIAIDTGYLMAERRQTQSAADAAAMAAAKAALDGATLDVVRATGKDYGAFNAGVAEGDVTVERPPISGPYAGDNNYVQVIIDNDVTKYFVGALYTGDWGVSAQAVAGIEPLPGDYALITLDSDADPGIYMNGTTGIDITGDNASAMSNSNISGSNNTNFTVDGSIDANDGIESGGGWDAPTGMHPNFPEIDDPLAGTSPPPKGTTRTFCSPNCTLQPGHYKDQSITVPNNKTLTLAAGEYYFENSSMDLLATKSRIQCTGCELYFDSDSVFDPKNGEVSFTAPGTGIANGIVFWYANCDALDLQGNGEMYFEGIFYAPCSDVWMHGNPGSETVNGQVVVNTLDVRGTSDLGIVYTEHFPTERPAIWLVQ